MKNKILVISEGPPPLGDTGVEGGALRAWGLAKGLAAHGFKVCFAYRSTFSLAGNASSTPIPENIVVSTWNGDTLPQLLASYSVVVMRYAMGEAGHIIAHMNEDHILVSDNYIPIAVEVAARKSKDKEENINFLRLQETSKHATWRADYVLYASPAQASYYIGYLAGINKLNPVTYQELPARMFEIPYGIDKKEKPANMAKPDDRPVLLWYGAFYSWFDMEGLIESLVKLKEQVPGFRLLIAGAKNPYNQDPGLLAHYEKTMQSLERLGDTVEHLPWTPFEKRFDIYKQASAIITWNHIGLENSYAWRTRLMDFVLAERPILTNGGDPLGEDLIDRGLAFRATTDNIAAIFQKVINNPPTQSVYTKAAEDYDWVKITAPLAEALDSPTRMPAMPMELRLTPVYILKTKSLKALKLPYLLARSVKKNGLRGTAAKIKRKLR